jgi:hypothetical protein
LKCEIGRAWAMKSHRIISEILREET